MQQEVEKYSKSTRILHWVHAGSFAVLFLTGLVLFIPPLGTLAQDGWSRLLHRVAAVIFVVAPLIYLGMYWEKSMTAIREAFTWGKEDFGWMKAGYRYYFQCDEEAMPPQGHMNTGQKMWWLLAMVSWAGFLITGVVMWFAKTLAPPVFLQWAVFLHDLVFIGTGVMFFVHIYMSVGHPLVHPLREGAWNSMLRGKVSVHYAKTHHGKWFEEIVRSQQRNST
jgi:formate dehydrogenase subunit gamma